MELTDILSEESVVVCTGLKTKREVLAELAQHAARLTGQDATTVFEALSDREALGSTGLGNGIAIPHGKCRACTASPPYSRASTSPSILMPSTTSPSTSW
jgi:mannitol/fructose-specific phosphotransferase system IIA component (Ntr-type)